MRKRIRDNRKITEQTVLPVHSVEIKIKMASLLKRRNISQ
jgi:hypothetical protein